jgi:hypothetical protein
MNVNNLQPSHVQPTLEAMLLQIQYNASRREVKRFKIQPAPVLFSTHTHLVGQTAPKRDAPSQVIAFTANMSYTL